MSCKCGCGGEGRKRPNEDIYDALDSLKTDIINLQAEIKWMKLRDRPLGPGNPYKEKENARIELNRIIDKLNT